jgi:GNAT superfamily N-acetyltransferase
MTSLEGVRFRQAGPRDAQAVAALHADSWRRHYRGAYSDSFLDGDVATDRMAVWSDRLQRPDAVSCTILAEDGDGLVGFAHVVFDDDPAWGALLDNLHVVHGHKRGGIGSRLLALTAEAVIERTQAPPAPTAPAPAEPAQTGGSPPAGLYLWVLEQNADAQAFYEARGGRCVGRGLTDPPGGDSSRLNGSPAKLRYAWPDPSVLLA